ncbi:hypothetical protein CRD_02173 [Raphidiopsis brookii D9]|nr:hypothetical protein CRD_02173 [Raphidiopsis brookii D9]
MGLFSISQTTNGQTSRGFHWIMLDFSNLNNSGRKKFLQAFLQGMTEEVQTEDGTKQPKWDLLTE